MGDAGDAMDEYPPLGTVRPKGMRPQRVSRDEEGRAGSDAGSDADVGCAFGVCREETASSEFLWDDPLSEAWVDAADAVLCRAVGRGIRGPRAACLRPRLRQPPRRLGRMWGMRVESQATLAAPTMTMRAAEALHAAHKKAAVEVRDERAEWNAAEEAEAGGPAAEMRQQLLDRHGDELRVAAEADGYRLQPAAVNPEVAERFAARMAREGRVPSVAWHGTHEKNVQSILNRGLLLPHASEHPVGVVHGNAYGAGIYAKAGAAGGSGMSQHYMKGDGMLVCGVVDVLQAAPAAVPEDDSAVRGRYRHTRRQHRHTRRRAKEDRGTDAAGPLHRYGGAYVAFEDDLICPLFRARKRGRADISHVPTAVVRNTDTGDVLYRPPEPVSFRSGRRLRRQRHHRGHDVDRQWERDEKDDAHWVYQRRWRHDAYIAFEDDLVVPAYRAQRAGKRGSTKY